MPSPAFPARCHGRKFGRWRHRRFSDGRSPRDNSGGAFTWPITARSIRSSSPAARARGCGRCRASSIPSSSCRWSASARLLQETARARRRRRRFAAPLIVCNDEHRFIIAEQLREIGIDAGRHRAGAGRPQHRPRRRRRGRCSLRDERPRRADAGAAVRPRRSRDARRLPRRRSTPPRRRPRAASSSTFGITPDRAGDRLRLHPSRRRAGRHAPARSRSSASSRSPTSRPPQRYLAAGGYVVEQRHVPVPGRAVPRRARALRARRSLDACGAPRRKGASATSTSSASTEAAFAAPPVDLDRLRGDGAHQRSPPSCPATSAGAMSARGRRCGSRRARTTTATCCDRRRHRRGHQQLATCAPKTRWSRRRPRRPGRRRDRRRRAGRRQGPRPGRQEARRAAQGQKRAEAVAHPRVYRPWGYYQRIDTATRFQVKRITVKPGAKLSLQKHHHRAEHWVVVSGTARVTRDDDLLDAAREQVDLHPARHRPPPGESRQASRCT